MNDWDEIRYFLAVARAGTVRGAAERLAVNHSTVLRRIGQLEGKLNVLLFDRLPTGYRLSAAGGEVFEFAEEMENLASRFAARIVGRDQAAKGPLRVAVPPSVATYLLTPDFAEFARLHPGIEIEVLGSDEPVNLTNRDADVAIRVVYDRNALPLNLHGIKGPPLNGAVYISRDLLAAYEQGVGEPIRWIVKSNLGIPDWARIEALSITAVPYVTSDTDSQVAALRQGLGIGALSCFVGDADPLLVRVPGSPVRFHGNLWVLAHGQTRKTRRVRLFTEFVSRRLAGHAPLLAGERN
jgi:DNA-binding transcriptional LysR family regulator